MLDFQTGAESGSDQSEQSRTQGAWLCISPSLSKWECHIEVYLVRITEKNECLKTFF